MGSPEGGGARGAKRWRKPWQNAARAGGSTDFRWKKSKKRRREEKAVPETELGGMFRESGDALPEEDLLFNATPAQDAGAAQPAEKAPSDKAKTDKRAIRERQRNAKRRRRVMHEKERQVCDANLRAAPEQFLWKMYMQWAGVKLTALEKKVEKWTKEQVHSIEERKDVKLIDQVKEVVGPDYIAQGEWKKKSSALPGVACVVLASSALRAVRLAPNVYDGRPVGKLFSKHIKIEEQKQWLKQCCKQGLAPSAAGTAKRVERLIDEGCVTLKHTSALVIDCCRDLKERNIFDFDSMRGELFQFLHVHARELVAEGKMKLVLYVPSSGKTGDHADQEEASVSGEECLE